MAVSTTITALPSPPHRGVDSQSVFVAKGEALFDALYTSTVTEMNTAFEQINTTESNMTALEASAESYALTAIQAPGTSATSTTSTSIGTGSKSITIEAGKLIVVGMTLKIAATTSPTNWMVGDVTAYNISTGSLTVNINTTQGTGSFADWTCSLSAVVNNTNALTANTLATPRTINGVSFDGSANINIEGRIGTTIASATTTTIGTSGLGETLHISGTTTITSFGVSVTGTKRTLIFDSTANITYNATSLIIQGSSSITSVAGLTLDVVCENGANGYWRVTNISHPSLSMAELGYLNGVTSNIQTQLDGKMSTSVGLSSYSPIIAGSATAGVFSYSSQIGRYYTIGNMVTVSANIGYTVTPTLASGDIRITLPTTTNSTIGLIAVGSIVVGNITYSGELSIVSQAGTNYAIISISPSASVITTLQATAIGASGTNGTIAFTLTYFT